MQLVYSSRHRRLNKKPIHLHPHILHLAHRRQPVLYGQPGNLFSVWVEKYMRKRDETIHARFGSSAKCSVEIEI